VQAYEDERICSMRSMDLRRPLFRAGFPSAPRIYLARLAALQAATGRRRRLMGIFGPRRRPRGHHHRHDS
jgi:hypothetical protein